MTSWTRAAACWRTRWGPDGTTAVWPALVLELYDKVQSHADPAGWLAENRTVWGGWEGGFDDTPYAAELLAAIRRKGAHWEALLRSASARTEGDEALYRGYGEKFLQVSVAFDALAQVQTWEVAPADGIGRHLPPTFHPQGAEGRAGHCRAETGVGAVQGGGEEAGGPVVCL